MKKHYTSFVNSKVKPLRYDETPWKNSKTIAIYQPKCHFRS